MREKYEKPIMEIEEIDDEIIMASCVDAEICCDARCDTFG